MLMYEFEISTSHRNQWLEITEQVRKCVRDQNWVAGMLVVFVPHTTAGVTINENADSDVMNDFMEALDTTVPLRGNYQHVEGNSAAHIKASLVGSSVTLMVINGELQLGIWQGIHFCEFDGPRRRHFGLYHLPSR